MCKLVIYARAPYASKPKQQRILFNKILTELGNTEKDGLGIAFTDSAGVVHHRKWSTSADFRGLGEEDLRRKFCLTTSTPVDNATAEGFVLIHGRTSTSGKGLLNAHPHVASDGKSTFALIHNGSASVTQKNREMLGQLKSTCDSELLLAAFMKGGMEMVSKIVAGYYAFGMIVSWGRKERYLHVVKDNRAMLSVGEMPDKSLVFATTGHLVAFAGGDPQGVVAPSTQLVFDHEGEMIEMFDIPEPLAYAYDYTSPVYTPHSSWPSSRPAPTVPITIPNVSTAPALIAASSTVTAPPVINIPPLPHHPSSLTDQDHYESLYERYIRMHPETFGDDEREPAQQPPKVVQEEIDLNDLHELPLMALSDLRAKIDKSINRTKRLMEALHKKMNNRAIAASVEHEFESEVKDHIVEDTGTSETHRVPISDDEAMAAAAALIQAEREAACVASPPDDEAEEVTILPGEIAQTIPVD